MALRLDRLAADDDGFAVGAATHTDTPSLSISTALVEPIFGHRGAWPSAQGGRT
jgi:hypothetical protein